MLFCVPRLWSARKVGYLDLDFLTCSIRFQVLADLQEARSILVFYSLPVTQVGVASQVGGATCDFLGERQQITKVLLQVVLTPCSGLTFPFVLTTCRFECSLGREK